ncbi:MAG: hypothetical protein WBA76_07205, partial [Phormidesmis sp.]
IPAEEKLPSLPIQILKDQGAILTEATNGILIGETKSVVVAVDAETGDWFERTVKSTHREFCVDSQSFGSSLRIRVPSLNSYIFDVLSISYPINLYPVIVRDFVNGTTTDCQTVAEYEQELKRTLSSEKVRLVISTLLSQASAEAQSTGAA